MKLVILACLAAVAVAAPQEYQIIQILRDDRVDDGAGNFQYAFESEDGIAVQASGSPSASGAVAITGSYSHPLPEGGVHEVTYTADENGFQPQSNLLPTPHPLPAHVVELLAAVEELKRQGATWDDQGRRLTR